MQNSRSIHVLKEMSHKADFYSSVQELSEVEEVVQKNFGCSTHLGVAISCFELESDDFDDNDGETCQWHQSIPCTSIKQTHIPHNDLELHNFV